MNEYICLFVVRSFYPAEGGFEGGDIGVKWKGMVLMRWTVFIHRLLPCTVLPRRSINMNSLPQPPCVKTMEGVRMLTWSWLLDDRTRESGTGMLTCATPDVHLSYRCFETSLPEEVQMGMSIPRSSLLDLRMESSTA